jgi:thiamine biosynthesis lipoprotein
MKNHTVNLKRRNFLRVLGLAGAGSVLAAAGTTALFSESFSRSLHQARQTRTLMGTYVQVTVLDESAARAEEALNNAFVEMARLENILTRFSSASPVAELNASGRLGGAPPELMDVLASSHRVWQASQGAFDITILPLLSAMESQIKANAELPAYEYGQARQLVGMEKLNISGRDLSFARRGMGITLDGIAKGYIVDQAIAKLRSQNIKHALVNAGGDIRALGTNPSAGGWRIKVQDPLNKNAFVADLAITDQAIATSGNYEAYFDDSKLFGHLISPRHPDAASPSLSSTVVAADCMSADALATSLFVMGRREGWSLLAGQAGAGGLLLERDGSRHSLHFPA